MRVDGPPGQPTAVMNVGLHGLTLSILRNQIWCDFRRFRGGGWTMVLVVAASAWRMYAWSITRHGDAPPVSHLYAARFNTEDFIR